METLNKMGQLERMEHKIDLLYEELLALRANDSLLDKNDIAEQLGISPHTFPSYVHKLIPFGLKKAGGKSWKMYESELRNFIKSSENG